GCRLGQVEIEHQGQVIGSQSSSGRADNGSVMYVDIAAIVDLIESGQGKERRKAAETSDGSGRLLEAVRREVMLAESGEPVVEIAGDDGRQMSEFQERTMIEKMQGLPATFFFP